MLSFFYVGSASGLPETCQIGPMKHLYYLVVLTLTSFLGHHVDSNPRPQNRIKTSQEKNPEREANLWHQAWLDQDFQPSSLFLTLDFHSSP